jgi:hypothetical protein
LLWGKGEDLTLAAHILLTPIFVSLKEKIMLSSVTVVTHPKGQPFYD